MEHRQKVRRGIKHPLIFALLIYWMRSYWIQIGAVKKETDRLDTSRGQILSPVLELKRIRHIHCCQSDIFIFWNGSWKAPTSTFSKSKLNVLLIHFLLGQLWPNRSHVQNKCDRHLHDNFRTVQLTWRWLHARRMPCVLLKVDIAKAFDSVA
jgi:hypothetical protein